MLLIEGGPRIQARLPASGQEISDSVGIAEALACTPRTQRIWPDNDSDWLAVTGDRHFLPGKDALKDLGQRRASLADRDASRHDRIVHRCTTMYRERSAFGERHA